MFQNKQDSAWCDGLELISRPSLVEETDHTPGRASPARLGQHSPEPEVTVALSAIQKGEAESDICLVP